MITIKEVAEKAGVSSMTVTRVINNSGYVSEKTREKIEGKVKTGVGRSYRKLIRLRLMEDNGH